MSENLPHLMESAVQIAWDYLEQTGQIDDGAFTSRFLMNTIEDMIRKGERRRLLLSNRAIIAYQRFKQERTKEVAAWTLVGQPSWGARYTGDRWSPARAFFYLERPGGKDTG
jgi:CubicO group peptidase (beta-lactamase class C family)